MHKRQYDQFKWLLIFLVADYINLFMTILADNGHI
jgi:hypothetical protein